MAIISSHTLNGSDGTHAGGIPVKLTNLKTGKVCFRAHMDEGGRLSQSIEPLSIDPETVYELLFNTGPYWVKREMPATITQVALRFSMLDQNGTYHMPIILNPNSYSMWSSA